MNTRITALCLMLSLPGVTAFAQEGPEVGGDVDIAVTSGLVSQGINGDGNLSSLRLGAVTGGSVGGDVSIEVETSAVTTIINGDDNDAEITIGGVGPTALGQ